MSYTNYTGEYLLDNGTKVNLNFRYDSNKDPEEKIKIGKFDKNLITDGCKSGVFTRKQLKPRKVNHSEFGDIIFQNHKDWLDYIKDNKKKIKSYQGEKLGCKAVAFLI